MARRAGHVGQFPGGRGQCPVADPVPLPDIGDRTDDAAGERITILYLLIPLSLILLGLAVWAFFWAVKHDQFEDLEGPAYSILFDEDENDLPPEAREKRRRQSPPAEDIDSDKGAER